MAIDFILLKRVKEEIKRNNSYHVSLLEFNGKSRKLPQTQRQILPVESQFETGYA